MARSKKSKSITSEESPMYQPEPSTELPEELAPRRGKSLWSKIVVFLFFFLILDTLLYGWPIVAIVNNKPIFRWQLVNTLQTRFGQQTLEQILSEELIAEEARKQKIEVTQTEIESKTTEIVQGLGENVNLDDLLRFQGLDKRDFENQLRLQLTVAKILGRDIAISDADIDTYIEKNRSSLTATQPAQLRDEAKQAILDQKISEKLQPWFLEIKEKAKIYKFL